MMCSYYTEPCLILWNMLTVFIRNILQTYMFSDLLAQIKNHLEIDVETHFFHFKPLKELQKCIRHHRNIQIINLINYGNANQFN